MVENCGNLEQDPLAAYVDNVSGLHEEGVLAILEQAIRVGGEDSGEVEG
jgi:hypothetical protein